MARRRGDGARRQRQRSEPRSARRGRGRVRAAPSGKVGGYNFFWIDMGTRSTRIDGKYRTSVIYDPPERSPAAAVRGGQGAPQGPQPVLDREHREADWLESGRTPTTAPSRCRPPIAASTSASRSCRASRCRTTTSRRIVQTDDHVMINVEWMHWARVIRLDSKHLPPRSARSSGDSIGRWEGDTLVVDTTNFLDMPDARAREVPRGRALHAASDRTVCVYQFTVEDSDYTAPYSGEFLVAEDHRPALRVRLPRGQLRDGQHPARRAADGKGRAGEAGRRAERALDQAP